MAGLSTKTFECRRRLVRLRSMTMGANEQAQTRQRNLNRAAAIHGFAGAMLALVFVMTISSVDAWYMALGSCLIAIAAVVYVAKAIIALRRVAETV
jgi:hypothetical protein